MLETIAEYNDFGASQYCLINESNEQKYLYHFQGTAFSIYEINDYGVDDEPEAVIDPITCSPNPFLNSTTISIKFNHPTSLRSAVAGELSLIKIYNVKGQLIKSLTSFPNPSLGMIEAVWDGKDKSGKEVKSGVYLFKLDNNDRIGKIVKLR